MNITSLIILTIIGFFIGWVTNWIAIQLLFWPRKKILGFQGLIPRRKQEIAEKIAEVSPRIMPHAFDKVVKIPLIGNKILEYFKKGVNKKISEISLDELESIIKDVARKEFFYIEIIGGVLGAVIGLLEALILSLI